MWLLNAKTLRLEAFEGDRIPPYAILSHRWELEEVSFAEVTKSTPINKAGWTKISNCCQQALRDDLDYVWADTCCIDKGSSAELSEAINSMFKWYKQSKVCYAYLADVLGPFELSGRNADDFARSIWFTRGWTLQELIAPTQLEFFGAAWTHIGSRSLLAEKIASVTGVDGSLLRGFRSLSRYSVAQRMSWASRRRTTRTEDRAYCLLGLFGVNIPLLYGEGDKAFARLQEEIMRVSSDLSTFAWSNASSSRPDLLLASSPADFRSCGAVIKYQDPRASHRITDVTVSAVGYRMAARLIDLSDPNTLGRGLAAILNCYYSNDITTIIALKLTPVSTSPAEALAQEGGIITCTIGWPNRPRQDRITQVDVLEAAQVGETRDVLIRRDHVSLTFPPFHPRTREFSQLWLRFAETRLNRRWVTQALHPEQHWIRSNRTFNLLKAQRDNLLQCVKNKNSLTGYPVYGAIAISNEHNAHVAVYFRQHSSSLSDGIRFEVEGYDPKHPLPLDHGLEFRKWGDKTAQTLQLRDGTVVHVELRREEISHLMVAHLAVTIDNSGTATMDLE